MEIYIILFICFVCSYIITKYLLERPHIKRQIIALTNPLFIDINGKIFDRLN